MSETFKDKSDEHILDDDLMDNLAYSDSDATSVNMIDDDIINEIDEVDTLSNAVALEDGNFLLLKAISFSFHSKQIPISRFSFKTNVNF